jgi:hypothetical protein
MIIKRSICTFSLLLVVPLFVGLFAVSASAEVSGPWWRVVSGARPSFLQVEEGGHQGEGQIVVDVSNVGDASSSGEVVVRDVLPTGELVPLEVEGRLYEGAGNFATKQPAVLCVQPAGPCSFSGRVLPYATLELRFKVKVKPAEDDQLCEVSDTSVCAVNSVSVSGGGAPGASVSRPVVVSEGSERPVGFGVEQYEVAPEEEGGGPVVQAGKHPYQVTGTLVLNQAGAKTSPDYEAFPAGGLVKDLAGLLPPGLIGNPTPFARCSLASFPNTCPEDSVIGVAMVEYDLPGGGGLQYSSAPIDNLAPSQGEPARFGFEVGGQQVFIDAHVRSGRDYGVTLSTSNVTQAIEFLSYKLTFWGVPGEASHNVDRGLGCKAEEEGEPVSRIREHGLLPCVPLEGLSSPPFLAMPTACNGPLHTSTEADSWNDPKPEGQRETYLETAPMPAMSGCNQLPFAPQIRVTPDGNTASSPSGLRVDVHVPQTSILEAGSLAQSAVRGITVALPAGVVLNPSGAGGLQACSGDPGALAAGHLGSPGDQIGFLGSEELNREYEPGVGTQTFTPMKPGGFGSEGEEAVLKPGINFCSNASKIGTVTIKSPLLPVEQPLTGSVYLASQEQNPFGSLIAIYIVAEDPVSGTVVKLAGESRLCQAPGEAIDGMTCEALGQIITTFKGNPQLAFEDAELHFYGGERAPLATPTRCGTYETKAAFVPWSAERWDEAVLTAHSSSTFQITQGAPTLAEPLGSACPGQTLPFNPSLTGGGRNVNAGAFSPFTLTLNRLPGEQNLSSVEAILPPGLSGILTGVELCREPQANTGSCGPNSLIGETTVSVGVGGDPYTVTGGKFYLTGPYNGTNECTTPGTNGCAPFGITFEVPAKAGPFDFAKTAHNHPACDCVLVRGKIEINPLTAALTVTSNPPGTPDAIPTSLEGVPLEIQHINAITTRTNFQFNPTNCNPTQIVANIHSSENQTIRATIPFQVTNCAALKFEPKFEVSTSGHPSKADGTSLTASVIEPPGALTTQANISYVKVELPKQLPSRLTTLQKACTLAQFNTNPATCPPESDIGHAVVHTPLIPVPLEGPAIFVSHGGEAFPTLTLVLQGYGVTIDLIGDTFISKAGITSTTFHTVPDQPFNTFTLTLHNGPYSALTAVGNPCAETNTITVKKKERKKIHGRTKTVTVKIKKTKATTLTMPTEFVGQNGATLKQTTTIKIENCPKSTVKHTTKHKKNHKGGKKGKK